jgi:hypothetical protein
MAQLGTQPEASVLARPRGAGASANARDGTTYALPWRMTSHLDIAFGCLLACAAIGCGSDDAIDRCETHAVSIATGFAGCVASEDDVGNPPPPATATADFGIAVYLTQPSSDLDDGVQPDFETGTDRDGFYQLAVPPGHYWLCTTFRRCIEQDVADMTVERFDYAFSNGPGWSHSIQ